MNTLTKRVTIPKFIQASSALAGCIAISALASTPAFLEFSGALKASWLSVLPWLSFALAFAIQYLVVGPCLQIYVTEDGTWMTSLVQRTLGPLRALPILFAYGSIVIMPVGTYCLVTNMLFSDGMTVKWVTALGIASYLLLLRRIVSQLIHAHEEAKAR